MPQTILALVEQAETAPAVLATASLLQQRLQAGPIQLLHICHDPREGFLPTEDVMTPQRWQTLRDEAAAETDTLRAMVNAWQFSADQAVWHERTGDTATVLRTECAMADFIVAGRPVCGSARQVLHTLLFTVQRASVIAPRTKPTTLGQHAIIAWKQSPSTETVLRLSMPLLQRAGQVTVLIGEEGAASITEEPAPLVQSLIAADVPVHVQHFATSGRPIGEALLQEAQARGGDLLLMGAYTHSRLREMVLGGATRDILAGASLPVLLAH